MLSGLTESIFGFGELAAVSGIVTDALTAFGLAAKDSAHFADVLAAASANSNTNVAMMGETFYAALSRVRGIPSRTPRSQGIMANSGIKASQAGRAIMTGIFQAMKMGERSVRSLFHYQCRGSRESFRI